MGLPSRGNAKVNYIGGAALTAFALAKRGKSSPFTSFIGNRLGLVVQARAGTGICNQREQLGNWKNGSGISKGELGESRRAGRFTFRLSLETRRAVGRP